MKKKIHVNLRYIRDTQAQYSSKFLTQLAKDVLQDYGLHKDCVLCTVTDNAFNMVSVVKQLNERPRKGSSTMEESPAEIREQAEARPSHQLIVSDDWTDLTITNFYD